MHIRNVRPMDYPPVIAVLNDWWGGRKMSNMLPKLFFVHFSETSFIAEDDGQIVGFLTGFLSQTYSNEAYIHFVGVHPAHRAKGIGRALYERFYQVIKNHHRNTVRCVTGPINKGSIAFHTQLGFNAEGQTTQINGVPCTLDYDGVGEHRVLFVKRLSQCGG